MGLLTNAIVGTKQAQEVETQSSSDHQLRRLPRLAISVTAGYCLGANVNWRSIATDRTPVRLRILRSVIAPAVGSAGMTNGGPSLTTSR